MINNLDVDLPFYFVFVSQLFYKVLKRSIQLDSIFFVRNFDHERSNSFSS